MTYTSTRAPKSIDWSASQTADLTLSLSRRGVADMAGDLAAQRIFVALHEAAHVIAGIEYGLALYKVAILGTRGKKPGRGINGCVYFDLSDRPISEARFHLAGAAHEYLMAGGDQTFAYVADTVGAFPALARHCVDARLPPEALGPLYHAEFERVMSFLSGRWGTVRTLACALLSNSSADGVIDANRTYVLCEHVRRELLKRGESTPYGNVLDHAAIERLLVVPADKLSRSMPSEINHMESTCKEFNVLEFMLSAAERSQND